MSDLVMQAKDALTSTLTKVDDALTAAAPTSAETSNVPDPVTGASTAARPTPVRKPSSPSEEKIAALYDHRKEHKDELLNRGVLKDDKIAPALQAKQEALKRAQLGNTLESQLKARPAPEELIRGGILNEDEDPTSPI